MSCRLVKAYFALRNVVPISDSAAKDITVLMIWHRVWMAPLLVGSVGSLSTFLTSWSVRKNGLWFGYVRILHKYRTHRWQYGVSCRWHDSEVWHQGGFLCSLINKKISPMVVVVVWACSVALVFGTTNIV